MTWWPQSVAERGKLVWKLYNGLEEKMKHGDSRPDSISWTRPTSFSSAYVLKFMEA